MTLSKQVCPICVLEVEQSSRYPLYVCSSCAERASDVHGRRVKFSNTQPIGAGFEGQYAESGEIYEEHRCFIDHIECRADEAYFGGIVIQVVDYRRFYNLEGYLFTEVRKEFEDFGTITPFNFFCILIWKANRAKNKTRNRLARKSGTFASAVGEIASSLREANDSKRRLEVLMGSKWRFLLPTATAVLAVLFPNDFTVYDARVCGILNRFGELANKPFSDELWQSYEEFKKAVMASAPMAFSLRDKDRQLWGKSRFDEITDAVNNV